LDEHIEWALAQQRQQIKEKSGIDITHQRLIRVINKGIPRDA